MDGMQTFAVEYLYSDDASALTTVRPEHRTYLSGLNDAGTLLASGPLTEGPAGALLIFRVADRKALTELLAADPFAVAGLIQETTVRSWDPVIGPWAA